MKNLRQIRIKQGLTQAQLAQAAGINQATVSKIEKGIANPTSDMVERLAGALNSSPAQLFGLPELQQRLLNAISRLNDQQLSAALVILEAMADPQQGQDPKK